MNLKLPPKNLHDFSQYYYCFFKIRKQICCTKIFPQAFLMIHEFTRYSFENIDSIVRRLCNRFFKAFVKTETDCLSKKDISIRMEGKQRREESLEELIM